MKDWQVSLSVGGIHAPTAVEAVIQWAVTMGLPMEALEGTIFDVMDDETGLVYEVLIEAGGLPEVLE